MIRERAAAFNFPAAYPAPFGMALRAPVAKIKTKEETGWIQGLRTSCDCSPRSFGLELCSKGTAWSS
jgi:hypothetical protein